MPRIAVALLAFVAFGCTTVRAPASTLGSELAPVSGAVAEPQLELWVESGGTPTPEELEQARVLARAALGSALAGRELSPNALGAADPLLLVRARAVARTDSRRSDQRAAKVGIVVGFVVIVAAVVVLAVLSRDSPRSEPRGAPARAAPSPPQPVSIPVRTRPVPGALAPAIARGARPVPSPGPLVAPRPPTGAPITPSRPVPAPAPVGVPVPWQQPYAGEWDGGTSFWLGFELAFVLPPPCCAAPPVEGVPSAPSVTAAPAPYAPAAPGEAWAEEPPEVQLAVPPPPELRVESRGFFAGDETVLEVDLFDRRTGALLWTRAVRADVDPRNAHDVTRLLDRALAGEPWARRTPR
ncbi:hypothetical protein [Anaeromyxobacter oryzisoli]|uniref:hypothetical protein n=1 Tax=Anaeromyxobacter oryzisoli TaxID=2925408 RepID=UPI001F5943AB|nr:hypothetical protein [Anaeromyxobacter sp. SG63]